MSPLTVRSCQGAYDVSFVSLEEALGRLPARRAFVTDENVRRAWGGGLEGGPVLSLPPGESTKSLAAFGECLRFLAAIGATRDTTVVAVGGGVVGDLAGFAAATYMRGVPFVQVPTTLLAMVDSSVGGKVGVDLPEGKNLAGAFHAPTAVYAPIETLATLPAREFASGMAEVWKCGFILDPDLVERLRRARLEPGRPELGAVVRRCIEWKARVVEEDEMETTGRRAILNFGHTVGHALEAITGYGPLLHGEAISVGMVVEARLSERLGLAPAGTARIVEDSLRAQNLPVWRPELSRVNELIARMKGDKKARRGGLAFSLLQGIGACKLVENVPESEVVSVLSAP